MFFRRRYNPWADLLNRSTDLHRELMMKRMSGEVSPERFQADERVVRMVYEDFTVYATIGRDRKRLGPDFVDDFEKQVRDLWRWSVRLAR